MEQAVKQPTFTHKLLASIQQSLAAESALKFTDMLVKVVISGVTIALTLLMYGAVVLLRDERLTTLGVLAAALVVFVSLRYITDKLHLVMGGTVLISLCAPTALAASLAGLSAYDALWLTLWSTLPVGMSVFLGFYLVMLAVNGAIRLAHLSFDVTPEKESADEQ